MFEIKDTKILAPSIKQYVVYAPHIAKKARPGQFVIVRVDEYGERFPLTLVDWDSQKGVITLVFQEVGVSTRKLGALKAGDSILDVVGPLGNAAEDVKYGVAAVVGGGVGIPLTLPRARSLRALGNWVVGIIGARSAPLLILEEEVKAACDELIVTTDDGSRGRKGFTSDALRELLIQGRHLDYVFAVGPVPMMRAVAEVTRPYGIKTVVSLNPIMVDGTGMCGSCRVSVGGKTLFACVDGPEFDAHLVDFRELSARLQTYEDEERLALKHLERRCHSI
ncbi:MAG: sulfide/dihydroorotate dehydrogenase-like FAD/NAD-binding protein [Candidatus Bathyarchaeia archaeon]